MFFLNLNYYQEQKLDEMILRNSSNIVCSTLKTWGGSTFATSASSDRSASPTSTSEAVSSGVSPILKNT